MKNEIKEETVAPDFEKIRGLLLKIKTFSERGEEHERDVARNKLEVLLQKHGMTYKDLLNVKARLREFIIEDTGDCLRILCQCIWTSDPVAKIQHKGNKAFAILTAEQFVEVNEKFLHYWNSYKRQKEIFLIAFVVKNGLSAKDSGVMSPQFLEIESIIEMMRGIKSIKPNTSNFLR